MIAALSEWLGSTGILSGHRQMSGCVEPGMALNGNLRRSVLKSVCWGISHFPVCMWIPYSTVGFPKLCCGIRFYYPHQIGIMLKDLPNHFYHFPKRGFSVWEGIKSQEYKLTPNLYDFLPGYDAFVSNVLLRLEDDMVSIQRGDPIALVIPVFLPKSFTLEELKGHR